MEQFCEKSGKACYASAGEATRAVRSFRKRGCGETKPYRCLSCRLWHITSRLHEVKSKW